MDGLMGKKLPSRIVLFKLLQPKKHKKNTKTLPVTIYNVESETWNWINISFHYVPFQASLQSQWPYKLQL